MRSTDNQQTRETDDLILRREPLPALEPWARQTRAETLRTLVRGAPSWCRSSSRRLASRIATRISFVCTRRSRAPAQRTNAVAERRSSWQPLLTNMLGRPAMSNTLFNVINTNSPARGMAAFLTRKAIFCFSMAHRHLRQARTRRILRSLSEEQLKDAGIDRSLIHAGPEVEAEVCAKSKLMSLR